MFQIKIHKAQCKHLRFICFSQQELCMTNLNLNGLIMAKVEEKLHKEKQMLREAITTESLELNKRVDKVNIDRMNDVADVQAKVLGS